MIDNPELPLLLLLLPTKEIPARFLSLFIPLSEPPLELGVREMDTDFGNLFSTDALLLAGDP